MARKAIFVDETTHYRLKVICTTERTTFNDMLAKFIHDFNKDKDIKKV